VKDGSKYEGDFEDGQFDGFGFFTFPKEDAREWYRGQWRDGKISGQGKLFFKNGTNQEGIFENFVFKY
jgi:hypothetical protein